MMRNFAFAIIVLSVAVIILSIRMFQLERRLESVRDDSRAIWEVLDTLSKRVLDAETRVTTMQMERMKDRPTDAQDEGPKTATHTVDPISKDWRNRRA